MPVSANYFLSLFFFTSSFFLLLPGDHHWKGHGWVLGSWKETEGREPDILQVQLSQINTMMMIKKKQTTVIVLCEPFTVSHTTKWLTSPSMIASSHSTLTLMTNVIFADLHYEIDLGLSKGKSCWPQNQRFYQSRYFMVADMGLCNVFKQRCLDFDVCIVHNGYIWTLILWHIVEITTNISINFKS